MVKAAQLIDWTRLQCFGHRLHLAISNRSEPRPTYCQVTDVHAPDSQDIDVLESIHKALHPLQEFTDSLSGEDYVSISYLKPVLHFLTTSVLAEDAEDTDLRRSIKTKLLTYLRDKCDDPKVQELWYVVSFMKPRFKTQYVSLENIPTIKTRLKTETLELARHPG